MVGARSALFLPYADLGLIVVDEEHDPAYKQEDGVHYHARDMAVVRGHIAQIPVVLSSATPSVETEVNARRGRYARLALPERFGGQRLPSVEAIDLRHAPPPRGRFISPVLAGAVKTALERREQALLFLNRRGYAPLTLCRACGFRFSCPNCDAWLVDHRFRKQLVCHHCGFAMPHPAACPKCQAQNSFVACGPGVERLEEEVRELFPEARVLVLSSDLVASVERMREEFADIAAGRFDIVIGTQLVAKGHHFPMLNLVGVVDADLGLSNGDPRAAERTFQLLHQVVGRAGRDAGVGHGFLQTHQPEHPVMRALIAQDREAFYSAEIELRERAHYPPFGRLACDRRLRPRQARHRKRYARALARAAPLHDDVRVLGPAEAPLALVRGRHRLRLLDQGAAQFRSLGLFARMARRRAEEARRDQARYRRRSAEFFVRVVMNTCMTIGSACIVLALRGVAMPESAAAQNGERLAQAPSKDILRAGHFLRNEGRQGEGISHTLRCPGRWRDQCSPEDRICLRRSQVAAINRRATGIGRSRRTELPNFISCFLTVSVWPVRAAQTSCAPQSPTRVPPKPPARRDRRRAVPASANRTSNGGRRGRGFWRGYRRTAGCLRARNPGCSFVNLEKDRAVENQPEHETVGIKPGAAEQPLHRHRAELREQVADEFGVHTLLTSISRRLAILPSWNPGASSRRPRISALSNLG